MDWMARHPLRALEHSDDWQHVLAVMTWFLAHPRPGLYVRQLDIPGVDTKFVEARKGLLAELLDRVLSPTAIDLTAKGARNFDERYGLRTKPAVIRFRILDERLFIAGMSDIATPAAEFARLHLPVERVFITENETNGLAFPDAPRSIVIFGLGYGLERLSEIEWLRSKSIYYWGDIDTHGFAILDRLRGGFPRVRSFLMDLDTLMAHRHQWVQEREEEHHEGPLDRLTADERSVYEALAFDRLGRRVRLEQERISYQHLVQALQSGGADGG
jgi:hypothetical protein